MLTMIYDPINNLTCLYNTMTNRGMVNVTSSSILTIYGLIQLTQYNVITIITSSCAHNTITILASIIIKILNIKCSS